MTIEKLETGFGYLIQCDFCDGELYLPNAIYFEDALAEMKDYGWRNRKDGDEWLSICPACLEKESHEKKGESHE